MDAGALVRPVRDALAHQLERSRGPQWGDHLAWSPDLPLEETAGLDSIEVLETAGRIARMFELDSLGWEDYLLRRRSLSGWAAVSAAALTEQGHLSFLSSGSQGDPRWLRHELARLVAEARTFGEIVGPQRRALVGVPTHHIYGFIFGVLVPAALDAVPVDLCGRLPVSLRRQATEGDLVVAHPLLWQTLSLQQERWPAGVIGVTSTAPCPPDVIERLKANGLTRMIEVYGSSETAGIGWRDTPDAGFTLLPRWRIDQSEQLPRLRDTDDAMHPFPDRVEVTAVGVRPLARRDAAVQVAGNNVYPDRVATLLGTHPGVDQALVRLDRDSGRLRAFIVPSNETRLDLDELRAWCRTRLSSAETPVRFEVGADLPRNVLGKSADW